MSDAAPLSPRIQFVDAKGYLTRDAILLLQQLQTGVSGGVFQPVNTILTGLSGMGTGTGIVSQTAAASFAKRTLQRVAPIQISNPAGIAGDPTISADVASDAEVIAGTDPSKIVSPAGLAAFMATIGTGALTMGTPIALSGLTVASISLPAGVKRVFLSVASASANGTANMNIQIGDSGGIENTGYLGSGGAVATLGTASFIVSTGNIAASVFHGVAELVLMDTATNLWAYSGNFARSNAASTFTGAGTKALSGELTTIEFNAGGDTFDASTLGYMYE